MRLFTTFLFILAFFAVTVLPAQQRLHAQPPGWTKSDAQRPLRVESLPQPDWDNVSREDEINPGFRLSVPLRVDYNLINSGSWTELANGDRLWQLQIKADGALGLACFYDNFYLPPGAQLFMYNSDRSDIKGGYTSLDNTHSGRFLTGFVKGDEAIIEYYEPKEVAGQGYFRINRVDYGYREGLGLRSEEEGAVSVDLGFGAADPCHVNANCTEGETFPNEKRAVCRILLVVEEGTGYCTGTLLNNARQDGTPYVLSAYHCQYGYTPLYDLWRFDFSYEASGCETPSDEPLYRSVLGCTLRAGWQDTDFLLLELQDNVPGSFDPYFMGWNRSETELPTSATAFHHIRGDIKKMSVDPNAVTVFPNRINWNNEVSTPRNHHMVFSYEGCKTDIGASGCAMINQKRQVVGQLHGESSSQNIGYYGRLALSWEGNGSADTRLKDWLDPDNTNAMTLGGINNPVTGGVTIGGIVKTENGDIVPGAIVKLISNSGLSLQSFTERDGSFEFSTLTAGDTYELGVTFPGTARDGVTVSDIIAVRKHLLGIELLDSPYQQLAADVDGSKTISILDLIKIQKVILQIDSGFEGLPVWGFLPESRSFIDILDPFLGIFADSYLLKFLLKDVLDFDFVAVKFGDVNGSYKPGEE